MKELFEWLVELNRTNHVAFGLLTVGTMAVLGGVIAVVTDLFFAALGIRTTKIEIQH